MALLGLLTAAVLGDERNAFQAQEESAVVILTNATFAETAAKTDNMLVMFHAPWCGHCKNLAPEWDKAAAELMGKVLLAKVDATVYEDLAGQHFVKAYPTIKFFRRGVPFEYGGGRKSAEIVEWVLTNIGPSYEVLDATSLESLLKDKNTSTTVFVATGDDELLRMFSDAADSRRGKGSFVFVKSSSKSLEVHRGHGEVLSFGGDLGSLEDVKAWLIQEFLADFGQVDESNFEEYLLFAPNGLVWVCFPPSELTTAPSAYAGPLGALAREHRGRMPFVWLDTVEYEEHAKEDLRCDTYPMVVIQMGNMTDEKYEKDVKKYRLALKTGFDASEVGSFFADVLANKVEPFDELDELDEDDDEEGDGPDGGDGDDRTDL